MMFIFILLFVGMIIKSCCIMLFFVWCREVDVWGYLGKVKGLVFEWIIK